MKACATSVAAFNMAVKNRPIEEELLFHSVQACKPDVEPLSGLHACTEFKEQLVGLPVVQSMSRKGNGPKMHELIGRSVGIML